MVIKMGVCPFILWLVTLTTTAQGFKSCSEIAESNKNLAHDIVFNNTSYKVLCDMSTDPVKTTIKVRGKQVTSQKFYDIIYEAVPKEAIRQLVMVSEKCKQSVSYDCKNAAVFTNSSIVWYNLDGTAVFDWGTCNEGKCKCEDAEKTELKYLTKQNGIPVDRLDKSDINVTIGDIVCYGGNKGAVTFENRGSLSSVNLTANEETISFKFKLSEKNANITVAVIKLKDDQYIKVGVDDNEKLSVTYKIKKESPVVKPLTEANNEWYKFEIRMPNENFNVSLDGKSFQAVMGNAVESSRVKLMFGEKNCHSFTGCLKDVYVGGKDVTAQLLSSPDKSSVVEGCKKVGLAGCDFPPDPGPTSGPPSNDDDDDDDGDDDNTAVIVIVVILLLLLILIIVAFFITWYLKRNKGMYQTHEGSAEDIHGDADNLTLVTKPSEQDPDGQKSKEYYL